MTPTDTPSSRVPLASVRVAADAAGKYEDRWEFGCGLESWHVTTEGDDCTTVATTPHGELGEHIASSDPSTVKAMVEALELYHLLDQHSNVGHCFCDECEAARVQIDALIDFTEPEPVAD